MPNDPANGLPYRYYALAAVAFVLPILIARSKPADAADDPADGVKAVLDKQAADWNRGDLDAFMAGYWKSDDLRFYSGGTVTTGWQATLDRYRKRYQADGKAMGTLTFADLDVQPLGPDAALARGRWKVTTATETSEGLFTLVLRRRPEGWRIVHDHTSAKP